MADYLHEWVKERERAERAERALYMLYGERSEQVKQLADVIRLNKILKSEVRTMQVKAEELNNIAYATGLIVHCTGCLNGGPKDYEGLTEEKVKYVEYIARRLRAWWGSNRGRLGK